MTAELYSFLVWLATMICGLAFVACFWPMVIGIILLLSKNKSNENSRNKRL